MGSEMCIRDREVVEPFSICPYARGAREGQSVRRAVVLDEARAMDCLLYTSDAADERSSVDLGGRRIIKKNKKKKNIPCRSQ